ncbi:MAG: hypothetical protein J6A76_02050, partial [Oscillospiraceae bacterium]|nr:hypothetical protein [Oscillospiraceae bacterium]
VRVNVEVPRSLNNKQKQALRDFEDTLTDKNYEKRKGFFERLKDTLRGQGDAGQNGGPAGDANITVSVRAHKIFERDGYDIWCDIPITFMQATLGDEIVVPTLEGTVKYNIPEGTQSQTVFRLKGRGVPFLNGRGKGDQFVRVNVEVPRSLNNKQKQALRDFEDTLTDKNYEKRKGFFERLKDTLRGDDK